MVVEVRGQRADDRGDALLTVQAEALHRDAEVVALVAERHPDVAVEHRDRGGPVQGAQFGDSRRPSAVESELAGADHRGNLLFGHGVQIPVGWDAADPIGELAPNPAVPTRVDQARFKILPGFR